MDNILSKVAYIDDGKSKMIALRNSVKQPNNILDVAFKKNHDWRKRLMLCDHFDGKVKNKGPFNDGDMVIFRSYNSHTYSEGMVLKRQKSKFFRQNSDGDTKGPKPLTYTNTNGDLVADKLAKYIVEIDGVETPVYNSSALKNHHVTIFTHLQHFFKSDVIGNRIAGAFTDYGEIDSDLHHVTRMQFCIELTRCLSMVDKLDWSQSCQEKYLTFVTETLVEVEKIYVVKLLSEELHRELQKRKSQKITPHGLGTLAYAMTGRHMNFTELKNYIMLSDSDNDGYLSLSDFVRFSGRPLLEQYAGDDIIVKGEDAFDVKSKNLMKTKLININFANSNTIDNEKNTNGDDETSKSESKKKALDLKTKIDRISPYDEFPSTQRDLIHRVRRLKGVHNPVSVTDIEKNIEEVENYYVELSRILKREDEVEEKILEYERKFDINENMTKDEISSRRLMLYRRCESLNIMYGWCDPKYWEYDHDLELYSAMAEEQIRREHGEV